MVSRLPKCKHKACHLMALGTKKNCTRCGNNSCLKQHLKANVQKPASEHMPKQIESKNQTSHAQQPNSEGAGGMGEALKYESPFCRTIPLINQREARNVEKYPQIGCEQVDKSEAGGESKESVSFLSCVRMVWLPSPFPLPLTPFF